MLFRDIKLVPVNTKNITANVYCKVHNKYGSHHKNLSLGMDGSVDKSILTLHCIFKYIRKQQSLCKIMLTVFSLL